jgi:hypothetical protein
MKRLVLFVTLWLIIVAGLPAQPRVNTDSLAPVETIAWTNIVFGKTPNAASEPKVAVISCRRYDPRWIDNFYASKKLEKHHKVWYMVAGFNLPTCYLDTVPTLADVLKALDSGNDFLFYIHGHGKDFNQSLEVAKRLSERYDINVVVFDWPARNGNLSRSMKLIRHSSKDLYSVLTDLDNYKQSHLSPEIKTTLLMHSLGNYYLIRLIKDKHADLLGGDNPVFNRIILNSAAIKSKNHSHCLNNIVNPTDIIVTQNENDFVLHGAQLLTWSKQLGISNSGDYFPNATYLNFSKVAEKQHNYFLGIYPFENRNPDYRQIFYWLFHGQNIKYEMFPFFKVQNEPPGYLINFSNQ